MSDTPPLSLSVAAADPPPPDLEPDEPADLEPDEPADDAGAGSGVDALGEGAVNAGLDLIAKMLRAQFAPDAPAHSTAYVLAPDERAGILIGVREALEAAGAAAVVNENAPTIIAGAAAFGYVTRSQAEVRAYRKSRAAAPDPDALPRHRPDPLPSPLPSPAPQEPAHDARDRDPESAGGRGGGPESGPEQPAKSLDSASLADLARSTRGGFDG